jgi:hypothetical protein
MAARGQASHPADIKFLSRDFAMRTFWQSIGRLSPRKKLVIIILLLVVVLTWLGVCAILGSYLV